MDKINEITQFHDSVLPSFTGYWQDAKELYGLVYPGKDIDHWTDAEKKKFSAAGRTPLNVPLLYAPINSILGYEKTNRNNINIDPVGKEDELNAIVGNKVLQWVLDQNDYDFEKDEVFEDGVISCYGVFSVETEIDAQGENNVVIERVPYNQIVFDLNFKQYNMKDCSRKQFFEWVYVDELIRLYPDRKEEILDTAGKDRGIDDDAYSKLRSIEDYYTPVKDLDGQPIEGKHIVKLIRDYKSFNKTIYELHDIKNGGIEVFESRDEAEQEKELRISFQDVISSDDYFIIKPVIKERVKKTVCTANLILEETDIEHDPFVIYFAIFKDGVWTPVTRIGKDLQRYADKLFAQLDYAIGTDMKTVFEMNVNALHPDMTVEKAGDVITKGGTLWKTTGARIVDVAPRSGANPQYFTILHSIMTILQDTYGGRNFQGLSEGANQSGISIEKLQVAASVMTYNYINSLNRFDLIFGRKVMKCISENLTREFNIKILGKDFTEEVQRYLADSGLYEPSVIDPTVGFLAVNKTKSLKDSKLSVKVTIKNARLNDNDYKFTKLMELERVTGRKVPAGVYLNQVDWLDATDKQRVEKDWEMQDKMAQLQAEQEQKLAEGQAISKGMEQLSRTQRNIKENTQN